MEFYIYDLIFLVLFCAFIAIFLYKNRKKLKREMKIAFLYKTKLGLKLINYIGKKYKKILNSLKYIILFTSYLLMAGICILLGKSLFLYIRYPILITKLIRAPPIAPLIPYFPKLFQMESFFPHFYFTYFIIALAIVAIVHELSHGIFMKHNKVKIKSTGIVFFGPILGAFVEQNEKDMKKLSKTNQMTILGAGVFANVVTGIFFFLIWAGIFFITFSPAGANFNDYAQSIIKIDSIDKINNFTIDNKTNEGIINFLDSEKIKNNFLINEKNNSLKSIRIFANGFHYFSNIKILKAQLQQDVEYLILYEDFPAINLELKGNIIEFDYNKIKTYNDLEKIMEDYSPGEKINLKTKNDGNILEYNLTLVSNLRNPNKALIGISNQEIKTNIAENLAFFKEKFTHYESRGEFLEFLYYLVFWIFLINLLVALFNMLPLSILDGGRFFYLTILGITKKEKISKKIYKSLGFLILFLFLLAMAGWVFGILH